MVVVVNTKTRKSKGQWRIETWSLADKQVKRLDTETKHYFGDNQHSLDGPMIVWEAYNTTIRGATKTREIENRLQRRERLTVLEKELKCEERDYSHNPLPSQQDAVDLKQAEYQLVVRKEVKTSYLAKQKLIYEGANKTVKLLEWLGSKLREHMTIKEVKTAA
ncbi:hypothetical protein NDU88_005570 [Pleurodeles waltl]|uniref:Uncharacterized protein n=1 Tax=Pleurodeles waltl TaxID=8319 RepID=A0AAV7W8F2_PLEWA|nr:hypothetical protein NDU88_005570 [Pleurodeles waltl]